MNSPILLNLLLETRLILIQNMHFCSFVSFSPTALQPSAMLVHENKGKTKSQGKQYHHHKQLKIYYGLQALGFVRQGGVKS